jgi:hypothetical protein
MATPTNRIVSRGGQNRQWHGAISLVTASGFPFSPGEWIWNRTARSSVAEQGRASVGCAPGGEVDGGNGSVGRHTERMGIVIVPRMTIDVGRWKWLK